MYDDLPANPYNPDADDPADNPFAGRRAALSRLHQQLGDPTRRDAIVFSGWRESGKTALLRHFNTLFDDNFLGVYVPVEAKPDDEAEWLLTLARAVTAEIVDRGFTIHRLSNLPPPEDEPRAWFMQTFLGEILAILRPHRRLVLLLDNGEHLLDAMAAGRLPDDHPAYLAEVLRRLPQVSIVMTFDAEREAELEALRALTGGFVERLTPLEADEAAWLLQAPVSSAYTLPDAAAQAVHSATGGAPDLLQRFGDALYRRWRATPELNVLTAEDVKAVTPLVYDAAARKFRRLWAGLSPNERVVLSAVSTLFYDDPLGVLTPASIQAWLVETDTPLDITAVNAALRSLEYRDLVTLAPGVKINAGLLQAWLIENARMDAPEVEAVDNERPRGLRGAAAWVVIALFVVMIGLGLYVLVTVSNTPRTDPPQTFAVPTVTLSGGE